MLGQEVLQKGQNLTLGEERKCPTPKELVSQDQSGGRLALYALQQAGTLPSLLSSARGLVGMAPSSEFCVKHGGVGDILAEQRIEAVSVLSLREQAPLNTFFLCARTKPSRN